MSELLDAEGNVNQQGGLSGQWQQKQGLFGPVKDTNLFGQPNVERDLLGRPVPARDWLGREIQDSEGRTLYKPVSTGDSGNYSGGGGDALAALAGLAVLVLGFLIIVALLNILQQILAALFRTWRDLMQRYPRAMLVIHLVTGMAVVGLGLRALGFDLPIQIGGAALVPGLWAWWWLTRHLPLVFLPVNAALAGAGLWLAAEITRARWQATWSRLATDLPVVENLSLMLAVLPSLLLLWGVGKRRWPRVFVPVQWLAIGAILWFLFMRVWLDWMPLWAQWTTPIPVLLPVGWILFLLPLGLWLWRRGQDRWPTFFFGLNLLVFGGILGLTAYHTQPNWMATWQHWTTRLPLTPIPLLVISLSPITFWSWSRVSRRWPRIFVIPNLLLTGGFLWLLLDHTRSLWENAWQMIWGQVPLTFDPALLALFLPLLVWSWRRGAQKWPSHWGGMRALVLGAVLWWLAERTRSNWEITWRNFAGREILDLALLAGGIPPLSWIWVQLQQRWPRVLKPISWLMMTGLLFWIVGRLLPNSTPVLRASIALLPFATWGWGQLLQRSPRLGWALTLLPIIILGVMVWLAPKVLNSLVASFRDWLTTQGGTIIASGG